MRERPRVLLIGDDQPRMARLRESLSRAAQVSAAEDLPHALAILAKGSFEVAFCDSRFHCATWREALESIGTLYPDLPIVVVSHPGGGEGAEQWQEAVRAGAFDLLPWSGREHAALTVLEHAVASSEARALRIPG